MIDAIRSCSDLILKLINIIVLIYGFYRFTRKPSDDLKAEVEALKKKVAELELEQVEIKRSLLLGNGNFQALKEVVEGITSSVLAIVDFEISYCARTDYEGDMTDLKSAQKDLRSLKSKI